MHQSASLQAGDKAFRPASLSLPYIFRPYERIFSRLISEVAGGDGGGDVGITPEVGDGKPDKKEGDEHGHAYTHPQVDFLFFTAAGELLVALAVATTVIVRHNAGDFLKRMLQTFPQHPLRVKKTVLKRSGAPHYPSGYSRRRWAAGAPFYIF